MPDYLETEPVSLAEFAAVCDETSFWSAPFGRLMLDHLELGENLDVLDLACGAGFPLFELAFRLGPTCRLTGVDPWKEAIERAEIKRAVYGLENIHLLAEDAATLSLPDRSIDLIVCNLGVNNFEDPEAVMRQCARVVRLGGRVALTTNTSGHMAEFYALFRRVLVESDVPYEAERLDEHIAHRGTPATVGRLLESAGLQVEKMVEEAFTMRYSSGSAFLRHYLIRIGFLPAWKALVRPERWTAVFEAVEQEMNAVAHREGSFTVTIPMLYLEGRLPA